MLNTLSHLIDLFQFLFNNSLVFNDIYIINKKVDNGDLSSSFIVNNALTKDSHLIFNSINFNDLYHLDFEFIFTDHKVEIKNYESDIFGKKIDENFDGYYDFKLKKIKISNNNYMRNVVDTLPKFFDENIPTDYSIQRD